MQEYKIEKNDEGKRLDVFISEKNPLITRSHIKVMIESGLILVDEKKVKAGCALKTGNIITMQKEEKVPDKAIAQNIPINIIYEDEDFLVINKDKGMVVHPAVKNTTNTLVNALLFNVKDLSGINGVMRPGIVHRLDKDTSGLMVVAKNDIAHVELSKQIQEKTCKRFYLAIVEGNFKEDKGEIITHIQRSNKNRLKMANSHDGKLAHTIYHVKERFNKTCLVEFELKTGRTHQIRVHCEGMYHPILGDKLYGAKIEKYYKHNQFLHAYKLELNHPKTKEKMTFEIPLPEYFNETLENLRRQN